MYRGTYDVIIGMENKDVGGFALGQWAAWKP